MLPRFYAPELDADADRFSLSGDEARHLSRVLRLGTGAEVRVFNGRGLERAAIVDVLTRGEVVLQLGERVTPARELPFALTLVQAMLKGDAMDGVIRDATMLGVTAVQPALAGRGEVPAAFVARRGRQDRWRRIAVSSAKQCGRAVVPAVHEPAPFRDVLAGAGQGLVIVLTEPASAAAVASPGDHRPQRDQPVAVFVGPEGGWTPEELSEAAAAGARFVTLGERTLRADAAALVALPVLLYAWGVL